MTPEQIVRFVIGWGRDPENPDYVDEDLAVNGYDDSIIERIARDLALTMGGDAAVMRRAVVSANDEDLLALTRTVRDALEGDSNDAEHDALADVASALGIDYDPEASL